jgi:hypothetical protein
MGCGEPYVMGFRDDALLRIHYPEVRLWQEFTGGEWCFSIPPDEDDK